MKTFLKILVVALPLLFSAELFSQVRVFRGNANYLGDMVLEMRNGNIYPAYQYNYQDILYSVRGAQIMEGGASPGLQPLYTFRDNKLYSGNAMYSGQIAYTFENGRIYKGNSTYPLDLLYNINNNIIYKGNTSYVTDAMLVIEGEVHLLEIFGIMLAAELIQ